MPFPRAQVEKLGVALPWRLFESYNSVAVMGALRPIRAQNISFLFLEVC